MSALDDIKAAFVGAGLPEELATTTVGLIEGTGRSVAEGDPGTPVAVLNTLSACKKGVAGLPGTFVIGIQTSSGWLVCVETVEAATGKVTKSPWMITEDEAFLSLD